MDDALAAAATAGAEPGLNTEVLALGVECYCKAEQPLKAVALLRAARIPLLTAQRDVLKTVYKEGLWGHAAPLLQAVQVEATAGIEVGCTGSAAECKAACEAVLARLEAAVAAKAAAAAASKRSKDH
jgi:hypothetical protein